MKIRDDIEMIGYAEKCDIVHWDCVVLLKRERN